MALITVFILHRGCHPVAATIDPDDATLTRLVGGTPATLTAGGLEAVVAAEREHDPAAPRRIVSLGGDIVALPGTSWGRNAHPCPPGGWAAYTPHWTAPCPS